MKKAYRVMFPEKLRVVLDTYEFDDSPPGGSEMLIETLYSGVSSGTELAVLTNNQDIGHWKGEPYPTGSGYSGVGKVVAVGDEVMDFQVGDIVFAPMGHASHHRLNRKHALLVRVPDSVLPQDAVYVRFCCVSMTTLRTTAARPRSLRIDEMRFRDAPDLARGTARRSAGRRQGRRSATRPPGTAGQAMLPPPPRRLRAPRCRTRSCRRPAGSN